MHQAKTCPSCCEKLQLAVRHGTFSSHGWCLSEIVCNHASITMANAACCLMQCLLMLLQLALDGASIIALSSRW